MPQDAYGKYRQSLVGFEAYLAEFIRIQGADHAMDLLGLIQEMQDGDDPAAMVRTFDDETLVLLLHLAGMGLCAALSQWEKDRAATN